MTDLAILIGVLGIIATLSSPLIAHYLFERSKSRDFVKIPLNRKNALEGLWVGSIDQKNGFYKGSYPFKMNLKINKKKIIGILMIDAEVKGKIYKAEFQCVGGFQNDRFLKLDYKNEDLTKYHFGSIILEMTDTADQLIGAGVGYGPWSKKAVYGTYELHKA
jgi:hypothetical protein